VECPVLKTTTGSDLETTIAYKHQIHLVFGYMNYNTETNCFKTYLPQVIAQVPPSAALIPVIVKPSLLIEENLSNNQYL
jgi:hypothetical protein